MIDFKTILEYYDHPLAVDINNEDEVHHTEPYNLNYKGDAPLDAKGVEQAHRELASHYSDHSRTMNVPHYHDERPGLKNATPEQEHSIHVYSRNSFPINQALIHDRRMDGQDQEHHDNVHEYLNEAPAAPHDFHVYTGVGDKFNIMREREKGATHIHFPAFTSTSIDASEAKGFAATKATTSDHPHGYQEIVRIHIKKGSKHGAYIDPQSHYPTTDRIGGGIHKGENEFLLNKGKTLRFVGKPKLAKITSDKVIIHDAEIHE